MITNGKCIGEVQFSMNGEPMCFLVANLQKNANVDILGGKIGKEVDGLYLNGSFANLLVEVFICNFYLPNLLHRHILILLMYLNFYKLHLSY